MGKPCSVRPGGECWGCIDAFREMIHRSATGATVHTLHNQLMSVVGACQRGSTKDWEEEVARFLRMLNGNSKSSSGGGSIRG